MKNRIKILSPNSYNSIAPNYSYNWEMNYTEEKTFFQLWSPLAEDIDLSLFKEGIGGVRIYNTILTKGENGMWTCEIPGDQKGLYYQFTIKFGGMWQTPTCGNWAKAVGVNGRRGYIFSQEDTVIEGWGEDTSPALTHPTDIILYELHIRDFTIDIHSGVENKGKFLGLLEKTSLETPYTTAIEHLKELGITHVHLMPIFDYTSVNEITNNSYNWGYDPQNFNAIEGSYSTDPFNPLTRIKEFKQLVKALHSAGISVIMDVVYNHTFSYDDSTLNLTFPHYYYRHTHNLHPSNGSGCGNEIATERSMTRHFIIQSLKYWMEEFHIDGFRFDLMGLYDIETMNQISSTLKYIKPSIFIYGEPWYAEHPQLPNSKIAIKKNCSYLDRIAIFNDDSRDALKGNNHSITSNGFVSGNFIDIEKIKFLLTGACYHPHINISSMPNGFYAGEPENIINYVSCHDDLCLRDKLVLSSAYGSSLPIAEKSAKLALAFIILSQGVPFIYSGEEMFRTKQCVVNTYKSSDEINKVYWDNKKQFPHFFKYIKGLISIRKAFVHFRLRYTSDISSCIEFLHSPEGSIFLSIKKDGEALLVIFNATSKLLNITLPHYETLFIILDNMLLDPTSTKRITSSNMLVQPLSTTILRGIL